MPTSDKLLAGLIAGVTVIASVALGVSIWHNASSTPQISAEQRSAFHNCVTQWLEAHSDYISSIGHATAVLKTAEGTPSADTKAFAALRAQLQESTPEIPTVFESLNEQRENGDPTGKVPPEAVQSFLDEFFSTHDEAGVQTQTEQCTASVDKLRTQARRIAKQADTVDRAASHTH